MAFQEMRAINGKMLGEIDPERHLLRFRYKRKRAGREDEREEYIVDLREYIPDNQYQQAIVVEPVNL